MTTTRIAWFKQFQSLLVMIAVAFIAACDTGPESLPAAQRPIPKDLPGTYREAVRKLPFEGAHNFRDLGGYHTTDGRTTRWGLVYRSDKLSDLSAQDQQYLNRLQLKRIVDFRSDDEKHSEPDQIGNNSPIHQVAMPIAVSGANIQLLGEKIKSGNFTAEEIRQFLVEANQQFVEEYTALYGEWLHSLLNKDQLPAVFHCTAGKDRTGFGAAILLLTLGADRNTVMQDYLATNAYTAKYTDRMLMLMKITTLFQLDTDALKPVFTVEREYLEAAFNAIGARYGSFEQYLRNGLKISPEQQQQLIELLTESRTTSGSDIE